MDIENALAHLKELSENHGAKCYLDAFDTISKEIEALKPQHNKRSTPLQQPCDGCGRILTARFYCPICDNDE